MTTRPRPRIGHAAVPAVADAALRDHYGAIFGHDRTLPSGICARVGPGAVERVKRENASARSVPRIRRRTCRSSGCRRRATHCGRSRISSHRAIPSLQQPQHLAVRPARIAISGTTGGGHCNEGDSPIVAKTVLSVAVAASCGGRRDLATRWLTDIGIGHSLSPFEATVVDGGEAVRVADTPRFRFRRRSKPSGPSPAGCPWQRASSQSPSAPMTSCAGFKPPGRPKRRRNSAQSALWSDVAVLRMLVVDAAM